MGLERKKVQEDFQNYLYSTVFFGLYELFSFYLTVNKLIAALVFAACKLWSQKHKHQAVSQNTPGTRPVSAFLIPEKASFLQKHVLQNKRLMGKTKIGVSHLNPCNFVNIFLRKTVTGTQNTWGRSLRPRGYPRDI